MGFFDLDEFAQEAEKISIPPHPLADKLSLDKNGPYGNPAPTISSPVGRGIPDAPVRTIENAPHQAPL